MNENTVLNDNQATLLDAHAMASALAERYQQAASHCQDHPTLTEGLEARREALEGLSAELAELIQVRDLLPKDSQGERKDLAELFDALRSLVDDERHTRLRRALAQQETKLVERLDKLEPRQGEAECIRRALRAAEATARWLDNNDDPS